jgi:hypothetical protein
VFEEFYLVNKEKALHTNCVYPISVTKIFNDTENDIKIDFFVHALTERFFRNYQNSKLEL